MPVLCKTLRGRSRNPRSASRRTSMERLFGSRFLLSEERRKDLVRSLGKMAEEAQVRVRANRRTALDEVKKLKASGELSEDGLHDLETEVQKLTDRFVKSVDDHLKHKEAEIMKV